MELTIEYACLCAIYYGTNHPQLERHPHVTHTHQTKNMHGIAPCMYTHVARHTRVRIKDTLE